MELSPISASWFITNIQPFVTVLLLCTTKKHHPVRWLNMILLTTLTLIHWKYIHLLGVNTVDEVIMRITPLPTLLHNTVLFLRIDYQDLQRQHKPQHRGSRLANFWAAMRVTLDYSAVGTRWQVRNVPEMPAWLSPNPGRGRFLARQIAVMTWQYLMLDFLHHLLREDEFVWNKLVAVLLDPAVAAEHSWLLEATVNIATWFILARLYLDLKWRAASLVAVSLGISEPASWPPMFGSSLEAYTVRNFWGKYWHQQLRWPLTATSSFLLRNVLHLPRPSILERYTNIFLCFFVSGIIHLAAQYKGSSFEKSGAVEFFTLSALAIMIEDCVATLWERLTTSNGDGDGGNDAKTDYLKSTNTALWKKVVGYIWTLCCLAALGPFYSYDMAYIALIEPMTLPVNVTELLTVPTTAFVLGSGMVFGVMFLGAQP